MDSEKDDEWTLDDIEDDADFESYFTDDIDKIEDDEYYYDDKEELESERASRAV